MHPNTPILVACGQLTDRSNNANGQTPIELIAEAANLAFDDSGCDVLHEHVDQFATTGLTVDAPGVNTPLSGSYSNVPGLVARELGIKPGSVHYATAGGNSPQLLVNHFANEIAQGRAGTVLLAGGEALHTMRLRFNRWYKLLFPKGKWKDKSLEPAPVFGDAKPSCSDHEKAYGLDLPAHAYPLFENALQAHYRHGPEQHSRYIGELFSRFSQVAAKNPYAWFQQGRSVDELIDVSSDNRMIAFPYTKLLNSMIYVNQAAAVIMTSVGRARDLGISKDKWIFMHGCADANDIWQLSHRANYHSSPALRRVGQEALAMAGKNIDEIELLDIYSCFPSAVEIGCDALGINHDDSRGLTLTGGLPYFGGPGNNYSMHAIAEMVSQLRERSSAFGLLNANGWFLTKHSVGIYSAQPVEGEWSRKDPAIYQPEIYEQIAPTFTESPSGSASIETYTVVHNRSNQPERGIVFARLSSGERCLAEYESTRELLMLLEMEQAVGQLGEVRQHKGKNIFYPLG